VDSTICQNTFEILDFLPAQSFDLIFADPLYNLTKVFNRTIFKETDLEEYEVWLDSWLCKIPRLLKPSGSIYICGDWRSTAAMHRVLLRYFIIRNRITWEREKGRGAKTNWKNNSEDVWFATIPTLMCSTLTP
jgi:site-specific DNA-methyltransferase (adenine-specific)